MEKTAFVSLELGLGILFSMLLGGERYKLSRIAVVILVHTHKCILPCLLALTHILSIYCVGVYVFKRACTMYAYNCVCNMKTYISTHIDENTIYNTWH